jgi:PhnB protein
MKTVPFLHFDGNCGEAMEFYKQCLDAELFLLKFSEAPGDPNQLPPAMRTKIMHSTLKREDAVLLMAADSTAEHPHQQGTAFAVLLECETVHEIETAFRHLSKGGIVTMPLQDTFWNARFGMLTDKFGVRWMLNHPLPKKV